MKHQTLRSFLLPLLFLTAIGINAKTCKVLVVPQHFFSSVSDTEVLSEADSLIIYACPALNGGMISYTTEDDLNQTLHQVAAYLADKSLEGEYTLWPIDADTKQQVGKAIKTNDICLEKSKDSEAVRMIKGDFKTLLKDLLFIIIAIGLAIAAFFLFKSHKLGCLGKILGCVAAIAAAFLGIVGVVAIAAMAFKYIFIAICIAGAVVLLFSIFGIIGKKKKWVAEDGHSYNTREEAERHSTDIRKVHTD